MPVNELINASLYVIALIVYWRKHKTVDTYFILMFAFAFTAIMSLLYEASGMSTYHTTLFPYFYMFFCFWLCFKPFQKLDVGADLYIYETVPIKLLTWIYIISGIISIVVTIPSAIANIVMGDFFSIRESLYAGEDIVLYNNQFERISKNIYGYLSPFGVVMTFYQIAKSEKNRLIIILLLSVWILNQFLGATLTASRGRVVHLILNILLTLIIFKSAIPQKVKNRIFVFLGVICIPIYFYLMAVSVSRFGNEGAGDSIFYYLGHAMQNFNENCFGSMHHYALGKYAFSYFSELLNFSFSTSDLSRLGYGGGTGFFTFLGSFYLDYGPICTLLLCLLLNRLLNTLVTNYNQSFSTLIIIVFFATFFMKGVFVIGDGYALSWIMVFVVYLIVKLCESNTH